MFPMEKEGNRKRVQKREFLVLGTAMQRVDVERSQEEVSAFLWAGGGGMHGSFRGDGERTTWPLSSQLAL